jgi:hypothetical protein
VPGSLLFELLSIHISFCHHVFEKQLQAVVFRLLVRGLQPTLQPLTYVKK